MNWGRKISYIASVCCILAACGPADDKPDPTDILADKVFLASNPKFVDGVAQLIRVDGYECPAIAQLWNKGTSPYGLKLEALCGPADGTRNAYSKLHYSVYPTRLKVDVCEEFGIMGGGCH